MAPSSRTQIFDVSCQLLLGALLEASDKCPIKISIQNDGMNIASAADCTACFRVFGQQPRSLLIDVAPGLQSCWRKSFEFLEGSGR